MATFTINITPFVKKVVEEHIKVKIDWKKVFEKSQKDNKPTTESKHTKTDNL